MRPSNRRKFKLFFFRVFFCSLFFYYFFRHNFAYFLDRFSGHLRRENLMVISDPKWYQNVSKTRGENEALKCSPKTPKQTVI